MNVDKDSIPWDENHHEKTHQKWETIVWFTFSYFFDKHLSQANRSWPLAIFGILRVHSPKATPKKFEFLTTNQIQAVKLGVFTAAQRPRIPSSCTVGGTIRSLTSEGLDALRERVIEVSTQVPGCWYKVGLYLEDHSFP